MNSKVFGQFIAKARREKEMTQAELADRIGVTDKAISRWERGVGFPDINTLEPLAGALDLSLLELMRSEKTDGEKEKDGEYLSESEVTEMMSNAVEMAKKNAKQDKAASWIAGSVMLAVCVLVKLSGRGNIGGGLLVGAVVALAVLGTYLLIQNKEDKQDRKIYSIFMLAGLGLTLIFAGILSIAPIIQIWVLYAIFCFVMWRLSR